jgi:hypothetical protein
MPDEEFMKWKRKEEDARAWKRQSPIYNDDAGTKSKVFNYTSAILLLLIIVFCVLIPIIGYAYGVLDMVPY